MPCTETEGPRVAADEGSGIEDRIRDEGKPLVDYGWGDDREEDGDSKLGGVGVDPGAGASATVLCTKAAHVRLERHAHQAVG